MRKFGLLLLLAVSGLAVAAPSALATTTDTCFDPATFGTRAAACQAQTVEHGVDVAQVRLGRHSFGWYFLTCARGDDVVTRFGRIGAGGQRTVTMDRIGLHNPACALSAVAVADSTFRNARATVTLFD
jgi:hypothetical protein